MCNVFIICFGVSHKNHVPFITIQSSKKNKKYIINCARYSIQKNNQNLSNTKNRNPF